LEQTPVNSLDVKKYKLADLAYSYISAYELSAGVLETLTLVSVFLLVSCHLCIICLLHTEQKRKENAEKNALVGHKNRLYCLVYGAL